MDLDRFDKLLQGVVDAGGSDLHLKEGAKPRIRVDGELMVAESWPRIEHGELGAILAEVAPLSVIEKFEEANDADFACSRPGVGRFRVNVFRQRGSVGMVMRHVTFSVPTIDDLNLPPVVRKLAEETRGLVLVTGPTGSGKTTTLAAMIDHINRTRSCHIVSIEDPIEILHRDRRASVNQREIGLDSKSFASAMRAALRQDPDVILVGEMRDQETVSTALQAAETGHLVLSTLHTTDAAETVNRVVEFFPYQQQRQVRSTLASALKGILGQRLIASGDGEGRVAAVEVMITTGRIRDCIMDPESTSMITELLAEGRYYGMQTFDQALADLVQKELITLEAANAAASRPHDFKVLLERLGVTDHKGRLRPAILDQLAKVQS
ncbi:MAG TPA: type IV pilus twitching motility protein PilT [Acidimicrobiales bacterium]|nr:type IV pilus twitching motility protein PilT [Acidimicrobiales bacterium]